MRRIVLVACAAVVAGSLATSIGQAQTSIFVGAGPTFPVGDYGTYAKTGWLAAAGFSVPVGTKGLSAGAELAFGSNKHSDIAGGKTNLFGGFGFLQYRVGNPAKPGVYLFGEAGALNHQYKPVSTSGVSSDDWGFAVGGGAGVDIPMGGVSLYVEARIITRSGTGFVPIMAGIAIPFGKK